MFVLVRWLYMRCRHKICTINMKESVEAKADLVAFLRVLGTSLMALIE